MWPWIPCRVVHPHRRCHSAAGLYWSPPPPLLLQHLHLPLMAPQRRRGQRVYRFTEEKKRKEKKKKRKKKSSSPHKDKGERGKGREITGPHLSKEVSSWSRKSSMSSPRSWAPRAESWVSRWRKSWWSADVSGDAPSKSSSSSSSSSSQPGRGGELLEEKGVGEEGEGGGEGGGGEHVRVEELALWRLSRKSSTPHHVLSRALFLLDLFERASRTLRKKRIRGTKGQG